MRPVIDRLLAQWDRAMTPILEDPASVAEDPNSPLRDPLEAIFTADSPYLAGLTDFLSAGYVGQDLGTRPMGSGQVQQTLLLRLTDVPDTDHLSFVFCSFNDGEDFRLSTGEHRSSGVGITEGTGEAVRSGGSWKLHRLQQLTFGTKPAGTPNPCPARVAPPRAQG